MITFKQFVYEAKKGKDLIDVLRGPCRPALNDMLTSGHAIWRGSHREGSFDTYTFYGDAFEGFTVTPRKDRTPLNTPLWAQKLLDDYFEDKFKIRLRSSSVFATSNKIEASGYGSTYAMVPFGKYDIYWSPQVQDLSVELFPDLGEGPAGGYDYWQDKGIDTEEELDEKMQVAWLTAKLKTLKYEHGDNIKALKQKNELMIQCGSYLMLSISSSQLEDVLAEAQKMDQDE